MKNNSIPKLLHLEKIKGTPSGEKTLIVLQKGRCFFSKKILIDTATGGYNGKIISMDCLIGIVTSETKELISKSHEISTGELATRLLNHINSDDIEV